MALLDFKSVKKILSGNVLTLVALSRQIFKLKPIRKECAIAESKTVKI
jgi:hypothetical protein